MATSTTTVAEATSSIVAQEQVKIQLTTRDPQVELPDKPGPILVSTNFKRWELSSLVNTLLEPDNPIPFEFIINGQLLSTNLNDFLADHGISPEATLNVEYVRALLPPKHQASFEHDDWVGAADILSYTSPYTAAPNAQLLQPGHERILSGSFDGSVRIWDTSGRILATSTGATAPDAQGNRKLADGSYPQIHAAKWLSPTSLVASGMNCYLRIMNYSEPSNPSSSPHASLTPSLNLYGHELPIHHIAIHAPSQTFLSASDDHTAKLWTSNASHPDLPPANPAFLTSRGSNPAKKSKLSSSSPPQPPTAGPLTTLSAPKSPSAHTDSITSTAFSPTDHTVAYTASKDSHLKTWDLATSACVSTLTPSHQTPLLALEPLPLARLLTVAPSRHIVLVDPRVDTRGKGSVAVRLAPHTRFVSGLAAQPGSAFGLASSSLDGTVRVWDLRRSRGPLGEVDVGSADGAVGNGGGVVRHLFSVGRRGGKEGKLEDGRNAVFGVAWDEALGLLSWGRDGRVQIDKVGRAGVEESA